MEAMLVLESSAALQRALPHIDAAREKFARLIADCQGGPIAGPLRTATEFTIAWLNGTYLSLMAGGRGVGPAIEVFALRPLIDASYARVWELLADLVPMIDGTYAHFIVPVEQRCQAAGGGATGEWLRANMQRELSAAHAAAVSEALRGMSQLALAARSWQLAHGGSLPDSLDVLAGDLLPAVPADPMTDQPLQYVRGGEAPRFYSVGLDRKDNQGSCDRKDDILGQKDHDICFSLTGLPANPITASRPASEPASAAATGPASAPDPAASAPAAAASAPASRPS
jgi:hypothetical protein